MNIKKLLISSLIFSVILLIINAFALHGHDIGFVDHLKTFFLYSLVTLTFTALYVDARLMLFAGSGDTDHIKEVFDGLEDMGETNKHLSLDVPVSNFNDIN